MSFGDDGYVNYVQSRLVDKDTPLQAPIPATRSYFEGVLEPPKKNAKILDNDNTTEALVRYIVQKSVGMTPNNFWSLSWVIPHFT